MNREQFRQAGYAAIDRVCDYYETLDQRDVVPRVIPGEIASLIDREAPAEGEKWEKIAGDFDRVIMPGITHWQHPNFFAYFPANVTYESILADIHLGAVANPGFNWLCSPAATELEGVVMDWVAKLLGLDQSWWNESKTGGGIIMGNASEGALTVSIAARERFLRLHPFTNSTDLVILGTTQTHSLGAKAAKILGVEFVALETSAEDNWSLRGDTLEVALTELENEGKKPFILLATIGTTSTGAIDDIAEITGITAHHPSLFLHIDAAWAGVFLALEECRSECFLDAINARAKARIGTKVEGEGEIAAGEVHSLCTNLHKSGLVTFQASCIWIRDRNLLTSALDVTPHYLRTAQAQANLVVDYRNWSLFLGRRFHSLKIWYTLRSFGVKGFRAHLRKGIKLGKVVEELIKKEEGVELFTPRSFSLVVFRLVDSSRDLQVKNKLNSALTKRLNSRHDIFLTETSVGGKICLRFCPGSRETEERHVRDSWERVIRPCIEEARKDVKEQYSTDSA